MYTEIIESMSINSKSRQSCFASCATVFTLYTHSVYCFARYFNRKGDRIELVETNLDGLVSDRPTKSFDYSGLKTLLVKSPEFKERLEVKLRPRLKFTNSELSDYLTRLHFFEYCLINNFVDGQVKIGHNLEDAIAVSLYNLFVNNLNHETVKYLVDYIGISKKVDLTHYLRQYDIDLPVTLVVEDDGAITAVFINGHLSISFNDKQPTVVLNGYSKLDTIDYLPQLIEDVFLLIYCLSIHFKPSELGYGQN